MHLGNAITLLCLSVGVYSYKIRAYGSRDCQGGSKDINVWDNTCATPGFRSESFEILNYGGRHQRAFFYSDGNLGCSISDTTQKFWADGGDPNFQKGTCINLRLSAEAYGSNL